jgi:hypothetical protein
MNGASFGANHTFNAVVIAVRVRRQPEWKREVQFYYGYAEFAQALLFTRTSIETFHIYNLTEAITLLTARDQAAELRGGMPNAVTVIQHCTNYTIHKHSVRLTAAATDADGDPLTYDCSSIIGVSASSYTSTTTIAAQAPTTMI